MIADGSSQHQISVLDSICSDEISTLLFGCRGVLLDSLFSSGILYPSHIARAIGVRPNINEALLEKIEEHFSAVAKREGFPVGRPLAYDHSQYLHQVPGGMISNFRYHLSNIGMQDRLQAVLEETARVREEFGHPIMVTLYSQFVGTQAALNVIAGERYKTISDEVILYALGFWGEEESASMDPNIRDRIVSTGRARELAKWELPQPSLQEVRDRYGGPGVSDDELLLRLATDKESVDLLRATVSPRAGSPKYVNGAQFPLLSLIETLDRTKSCRHVRIQKEGLSITLARNATAPKTVQDTRGPIG